MSSFFACNLIWYNDHVFLWYATGFVREFNQISANASGQAECVKESLSNFGKKVDAHFSVVTEPTRIYSQNTFLGPALGNNKIQTERQNQEVQDVIRKQALLARTNADGLGIASGNLGSDGKVTNLPIRNQCQNCHKTYTSTTNLMRHQQFHCNSHQKRPFHCKYCEKLYVSLGALKMHIRTHTLPCKCKICGKAFSRPWLLQGHVRTHTGEKPYKCTYCQRAFADRSNLRAHLQTHSDVKKYCCPRCSKSFSRMSLLMKHEDSCPVTLQHAGRQWTLKQLQQLNKTLWNCII